MTGTTPPTESERVRDFRLCLAKQIPRFPNDRASLRSLERKSLGSLLIDYANWAIRYIAPRPRKVVIEPTALMDSRWNALQRDIDPFLEKVKRGHDLTPHLSRKRTRGYTPAASAQGPDVDLWADKDKLLNVMGYHHFHPSMTIDPRGLAARRNEIIFAFVTREEFTVSGIFDHSVFQNEPGQPLNPECERLWQIFDERLTRDVPPGAVVAVPPIAESGHSMHLVYLAMGYARLIADIDQRIDDPAYISAMTTGTGFTLPAKAKWGWYLYCLDLGLMEKESGAFFVFSKGPN